MTHHIVWWFLREDLSAEEKAQALEELSSRLLSLKNTVHGVISLEVTSTLLPRATLQPSLVLHSVHQSPEALEAYYVHPGHTDFVNYARTVTVSRQLLDFQTP